LSERAEQVTVPDDGEVADTTTCDGYCGDEVYTDATVDVVAGAKIGEYATPEKHVGIAGVAGGYPETEQWCVTCAHDKFGIKESAKEKRVAQAKRYITSKTVAAFCLGFGLFFIGQLLF